MTKPAMTRYFIIIETAEGERLFHCRRANRTEAYKYAMERAKEYQGKITLCRPAKNQEGAVT